MVNKHRGAWCGGICIDKVYIQTVCVMVIKFDLQTSADTSVTHSEHLSFDYNFWISVLSGS